MPLSEDEQRILSEIEQQLYESDPDLVREVGSTTVYTHAFRNLKWAFLAFFVGVGVMVFTLQISYLVSFVGFLIMLGAAIAAERNARRLGRAGWEQMTQNMRGAGMRDMLGNTSQKMRERMKREEDEEGNSEI